MARRAVRIAISVVTAIGLLGAAAVTAAGRTEPTPLRPTRPGVSAPTSVTQGDAFRIKGHKHAAPAGKMRLQRKVPGGSWHTVGHKRVSARHPVAVFSRTESRAGGVWFRVRLGHRTSPRDKVTVRRPPPVLLLGAGVAGQDDIFVGDTYLVSGLLTQGSRALAGRTVTVQRMLPNQTAFTTVGRFVTDATGSFSFPDSSRSRGIVQYTASGAGTSGFVALPVLEVVSMPAARGPRLTLTDNLTGSCRSSIAGGSDVVTLRLTGHATRPRCRIQGGDYVNVEWHLPGTCTPVRVDNLVLANGPGPNPRVRMRLWVEDAPTPLIDEELAEGQSTGSLTITGDPVSTIDIRMTVIGSSGNYASRLVNVHATCL